MSVWSLAEMENIKKLNQLKDAKEMVEERSEEAKYVQKFFEADKDAVSSFIHMHIYCRLLILLTN